MLEEFLAESALPNLHPMLVHFPLALLPVAFAFDIAALIRRSSEWLTRATTCLYILGAAGAAAALRAGSSG